MYGSHHIFGTSRCQLLNLIDSIQGTDFLCKAFKTFRYKIDYKNIIIINTSNSFEPQKEVENTIKIVGYFMNKMDNFWVWGKLQVNFPFINRRCILQIN